VHTVAHEDRMPRPRRQTHASLDAAPASEPATAKPKHHTPEQNAKCIAHVPRHSRAFQHHLAVHLLDFKGSDAAGAVKRFAPAGRGGEVERGRRIRVADRFCGRLTM